MSDTKIEQLKTEIEKVKKKCRTARVRYYIEIGHSDEEEAFGEYSVIHGVLEGLESALEIMENTPSIERK